MGILLSFGTMFLALMIAGTAGIFMGRLSTQWFGGRSVANLVTEVRAALLPILVLPALGYHLDWPQWLLLAAIVGLWQAGAVARWIGRRSGEWSPALVGGIALGRSGAALITRRAAARGAVIASLGSTCLQVAAVEGLLVLVGLASASPTASLGAWLLASDGAIWLFAVGALALLLVASEWASAKVLQSGERSNYGEMQ